MIDITFKQNGDTYVCVFSKVGWTYSECSIYKEIKLFGFIPWRKFQYSTNNGFAKWYNIVRAHPNWLMQLANEAFTEFWAYKTAWEKHHEHNEKLISRG